MPIAPYMADLMAQDPRPMPTVIVLEALKVTLEAVDWSAIGQPGFTWRHERQRNTSAEERPAGAIEWQGDQVREADDERVYLTMDEMLMAMSVSLTIDLDLEPEESDEARPVEVEDPTGLRTLTQVGMTAVKALKAEGAEIRNWTDAVALEGLSPDEDGTGDEGRLVIPLTVLYRVRTDDPSELLAMGAQA